MRRGHCQRHGPGFGPCSCSLGRMPRLVEPIILNLLAQGRARHGYEILELANAETLTDSPIDAAVVYRTLHVLEQAGCVVSSWRPGEGAPRRRVYELTPEGRQHLRDWLTVLERHAQALLGFVARASVLD